MRRRLFCLLTALLLPVCALGEAWVRVPQSMADPGWIVADVGTDEATDRVCVAGLSAPHGYWLADSSGVVVHYRSAAAQLWLSADTRTQDEAAEAFIAALPETKATPERTKRRMAGRVWQCVCASLAWGAVEGEAWRTMVFLTTDAAQGTTLQVTYVSADPDADAVLRSMPALLCGLSLTGTSTAFADTSLIWGMRVRDLNDLYGDAVYTVALDQSGWKACEYVITLWDDSVAELDCLLLDEQLRMLLLVPEELTRDQLADVCTQRFGEGIPADPAMAANAFSLIRATQPEAFADAISWQTTDATLILCTVDGVTALICLDPTMFPLTTE